MSSSAWVLVVVVSRREVVLLASGASKASRSGSRVAQGAGLDRPPRARDLDARPAERRVELAADGEHGVADLLGVEPMDHPLPDQSILRVHRAGRGELRLRPPGRLAVRRRGQDHPMDRLPAPPSGHELARQPVEQLGMAGRLPQPAEVAGSADQAASEVILPDPVDDHPGRERVVRPAEPSGQGQSTTGRSRRRRGRFDPRGAGSRAAGIPGRSAVASDRRGSPSAARWPDVGRRHHRARLDRLQGIESPELGLQRGPAFLIRPFQDGRDLLVLIGDLSVSQGADLAFQRRTLRFRLARIALMSSGNLAVAEAVPLSRYGRSSASNSRGPRPPPSPTPRRDRYSATPGPRHRQVVAGQERCEKGLEPVIVLLKDRVELVIVAAGEADAQPEEDLAGDVGDVVEDVGPLPGARSRWLYS